jgi:two-component system LytT family sensor kinase
MPPAPLPETLSRDQIVLDLLVEALPHLRGGLRTESAAFTAGLLFDKLGLDAAAVVSATDGVLAYIGAGSDHHVVGSPHLTEITRRTLVDGRPYTTSDRSEIGCPVAGCPITSVTIAPFVVRGNVVGALKLYRAGRDIEERDARVAIGLARVFSVYLEVAELDARAARAALTRIDPHRAHDLIVDFADYFRETLVQHGEFVTLDDELATVERYLRFEEARFGANLRVALEIEPRARTVLVPVLTVQPLVENAIAHGLGPRNGRGSVRVTGRSVGERVEIAVIDDGVGIAPEALPAILERGYGTGLGMGLNNVHQRLIGAFGPDAGLHVRATAAGGTTVVFSIPRRDLRE